MVVQFAHVGPEAPDGGVDHQIVAPAQQGVGRQGRQTHRPLHHLDGPAHIERGSFAGRFEGEVGGTLEVAVDGASIRRPGTQLESPTQSCMR